MTAHTITVGTKVSFNLIGRPYTGIVKSLGTWAEIDVGGRTIKARPSTLVKA